MRRERWAAVWYPGFGGFARFGRWSVSLLWREEERSYVPLSERYGTTRTWRLGPLGVRRRGQIHGRRG